MNNNEPDTLPDPAIGYIFQNDIVALKQAFSLPDIDYADISQREQLAAALKRWPSLRNKSRGLVNGRTGIAGGSGRRGDNNHHRRISLVIINVGRKCPGGRCLPGQLVAPVI